MHTVLFVAEGGGATCKLHSHKLCKCSSSSHTCPPPFPRHAPDQCGSYSSTPSPALPHQPHVYMLHPLHCLICRMFPCSILYTASLAACFHAPSCTQPHRPHVLLVLEGSLVYEYLSAPPPTAPCHTYVTHTSHITSPAHTLTSLIASARAASSVAALKSSRLSFAGKGSGQV